MAAVRSGDVSRLLSTYSGVERALVEQALDDERLRRRRWGRRRARRLR